MRSYDPHQLTRGEVESAVLNRSDAAIKSTMATIGLFLTAPSVAVNQPRSLSSAGPAEPGLASLRSRATSTRLTTQDAIITRAMARNIAILSRSKTSSEVMLKKSGTMTNAASQAASMTASHQLLSLLRVGLSCISWHRHEVKGGQGRRDTIIIL